MRALIVLILFCAPLITLAETINAGFVQGLWFSETPIFAGDTVRVYVAVRNNTDTDLSGKVSFYDNDKRFERMNVQALSGRIVEAWADWTPSYGEHTIRADLSQIEIEAIGEENQNATVTAALAETLVFIDYDTDNDGEGNFIDDDDDNDGVSDEDELEAGTDPLTPDKPEEDEKDEEETNAEDDTYVEDGSADGGASINVGTLPLPNNGPAGLEQYLTDSRARSTLFSFTQATNEAKKNLDTYRSNREVQKQNPETTTEPEETAAEKTDDGLVVISDKPESGEVIGEITRTSNPQEGWLSKTVALVTAFVSTVFDFVYTWLLTGLSTLLGHPVILQILLLCLILFLIIKLAHKLSKRPE